MSILAQKSETQCFVLDNGISPRKLVFKKTKAYTPQGEYKCSWASVRYVSKQKDSDIYKPYIDEEKSINPDKFDKKYKKYVIQELKTNEKA